MSQTINYETFEPRDLNIYDELLGLSTAVATTKGAGVLVGDVFAFELYGKTAEQIAEGDDDKIPIYRMRQVMALKRTGTGEAITPGEKIYYYPGDKLVSSTATGTAGTDYYFCGWAKEAAAASAVNVLINFDGTRYDEDL